MIEQDKLLSIKEAAKILNISEKTLRRWENKGVLLPLRTKGGHRRYKFLNLLQFKQKKGKHNLTQNRISVNSPQLKENKIINIVKKSNDFTPVEYNQIVSKIYKETPIEYKRLTKLIFFTATFILLISLATLFIPSGIKNLGKSSINTLIANTKKYLPINAIPEIEGVQNESLKQKLALEKEGFEKVLAATSFKDMLFSVNIESKFSENSIFKKDVVVDGNQRIGGNQTIGNGTPTKIDSAGGDLFITDTL